LADEASLSSVGTHSSPFTMPFNYSRTVRFADTDAAGVVFFANYLSICHEAYEESLMASGIELQSFFKNTGVVVPISKSEAAYLRPLFPGDKLTISVAPKLLSPNSFSIDFELQRTTPVLKTAARIRTEHVATSPAKRERIDLPPQLAAWVQAG
jgi:1,4-dihydroxy-2-naphthoyl-CoA hydrolase